MAARADDLRPVPNRRVPHDLEAEQSLLGAMLLSRDAIAAAIEVVGSDDFYKPAHAHVFDAIRNLYGRGEPADPVTVADELRRADLIEAIGGPGLLLKLQAAVPATGAAARYARIVEELSLLRRLIGVAGEISELGYSLPDDVGAALDMAETKVFEVANRRVADSTGHLRDLLGQCLDHLETLFERGDAITGVPTGFSDLDHRLSGLQPSNLVIVGARPGTGKALALDTPLPTPTGWTTMGDVAVGEEVLDEQGNPCFVLAATGVMHGRPCFDVVFDDGSVLVADAEHQWTVRDVAGRRRTVTTAEMVAEGVVRVDGSPAWHVRVAGPVDLPAVDPPANHYELGWRLVSEPGRGVPPALRRGAAKDRLALLQGVLDAAGAAGDDGEVELCLDDAVLLEDVREVACTLGHKVPVVEEVGGGGAEVGGGGARRWRLAWTPPEQVFRLERKAQVLEAHLQPLDRTMRRAIVAIRPVPSVPVRCISVSSPSCLYLAGRSMIPTHNTSFALGIAANAALQARRPVLFFSLEMSKLEITNRLLCGEAKVDSTRMRNGRLLDADWSKISAAMGRLYEADLYIDDNPMVTVMDVRAKARRLKSQLHDIGLVVVDYIQLMTGRHNAESRQVEVSEISRGLKILARELECPVIALSQLSRNLEQRGDKRPMLSDLRESGSLEQDADVVMFLYRDELYDQESPDKGVAEVIVAKHRAGPTGTCKLAFLDNYTKFANMAKV